MDIATAVVTGLATAVEQRAPGALRLGSHVVGAEQGAAGVRARLADGAEIAGAALIAADGVHSTIRAALMGPERPTFTGHVAYRMLVPRDAMSTGAIPPPAVVLRLGPRGHVVSYWVRGGELYNVAAVVESSWRDDGWRIPADPGELREAFRGWAPDLRALLDAGTDVHKWALLQRAVPATWSSGRVTLLGDACHAVLPYLAQGAAMAIEDAWTVAGALASDDHVPRALRRYETARRVRVTRVHAEAARNAKRYHLEGAIARRLRDGGLRVMNRLGGDTFLRRFDWLYGHQPITPSSWRDQS